MILAKGFGRFVVTGAILMAFVAVGFLVGQNQNQDGLIEKPAYANSLPAVLESAAGGQQMSLATGRIEDGIEALFGLDHLTGDLFCWILSPTTGAVASTFRVNVTGALSVDGDADYVLTTGLMDFRIARSGGQRVSHSVVYVSDGNSGRVVGYSLVYDSSALSRGITAAGELTQITRMITRQPGTVRQQGNR